MTEQRITCAKYAKYVLGIGDTKMHRTNQLVREFTLLLGKVLRSKTGIYRMGGGASLVAQLVKNPPPMWETWV